LVHRHPDFSSYFIRTDEISPKGLGRPQPYRIVHTAPAGRFIYGGVVKLFDPKAFSATVTAYDLVPESLLTAVAVSLPVTETTAGLALIVDRPWGLRATTGLLALFLFVPGYGILGELNAIAAASGPGT
jgi:hypothetical protein